MTFFDKNKAMVNFDKDSTITLSYKLLLKWAFQLIMVTIFCYGAYVKVSEKINEYTSVIKRMEVFMIENEKSKEAREKSKEKMMSDIEQFKADAKEIKELLKKRR